MKRILRSLAKLRVPLGIQQLDIPGLCLDGPSVEIVGFSLDCTHISGLILEARVKPHSDSTESVVCLSDEEVNYIHLGNRWVCVNATSIYLFYCTTTRTGPGSLSLTVSWTMYGNWNWHLKVFFISLPNSFDDFSLVFFHVFSLPASSVVRWNSLNTVVLGRNPWPLTFLQSLQHVRAKCRVFPWVPPIPLWSKTGRQKERFRTIGLAVCCSQQSLSTCQS